ncbi:MAG: CapA family protein [Ruminococcaceae bacterium]|nr:CapA family protein [Oscillospiraceae bacterium]
MKQFSFCKAAAAIAAAALTCFTLSSCSMFRPIDGAGREDVTDSTHSVTSDEQTSDTQKNPETTPPETTEPITDTTSVTTPSKPLEKRVSILAVGDNIIHEAVYVDAAKRAADGKKYDFLPMYSSVAERIAAADIAFINHETPMAGESYGISGYPTFNAPQEAGHALADVGFDVINLANNHIMDKRAAGAKATVSFVQSLPVTELGVYLDQADYEKIRITEKNGIKIAWVAFCQESNNPYSATSSGVIMNMMNDDSVITKRIQAADKAADFVIVSAHWGKDNQAKANDDQHRFAKLMAEAGADVIIGHHPHILQSVEWLTTSSGEKTLVAYSLGNFLSSQLDNFNMIGGMLCFDIVMDESGRCKVDKPMMDITVNHYAGKKDSAQQYGVYRHAMQMYMLDDYTEALAAEHGCRFFSSEFSVKWIEKHVRAIIAEEFLPPYFE